MPASFESFGVKFLYPDNWTIVVRDEQDGPEGVTLELPSGGFFALERDRQRHLADEVIEEVAQSIGQDYGEVEREEIQLPGASAGERAVDFRFYYLDLLITSRLVVIERDDANYVVQFQAENRDFDQNEPVFDALLQQIRST